MDYALYMLTGAVFGAVVAIVYQVKRLTELERRMISLERRILEQLKKKKSK